LPTGPAGRVTNYWAGITSITSTAKSPDAAWEVTKFIAGDQYQRMMTVTLPESASPSTYRVVAGLYDPLTNQRWRFADGQDGVELGQFTVP